MKKSWWSEKEGFFGKFHEQGDDSVVGMYYDRKINRDQRTMEEVEGVIRLCNLKKSDKILDCPSGWGRHAIALAKKGFKVIGVDLIPYNLNLAKKDIKNKKLDVKFFKKDMRCLGYRNEFDVVLNLNYSFGFFEKEKDNLKSLKEAYNALRPGGKFLMHTHKNLPWVASGELKEYEKRELRNGGILRQAEFHEPKSKRNYGFWIIEHNGKVEMKEYSVRLYSKQEFKEMCLKVGFKKVKFYSDWLGSPYSEKIRTMIVVAEK